jgi:plasmid stabilization system protein ParE
MLQYDLAFAAQADLEEIACHTVENRGEKQAEQYASIARLLLSENRRGPGY